ncbi:hypothetical protein ACLI4Y_14120 [Natrialbaceae archaeon A-CW3]
MGGHGSESKGEQNDQYHVTVEKEIETRKETVTEADIHVRLESEVDHPSTVVIEDVIPSDPPADIEFFHPVDGWTVDDSTLTFVGRIEPATVVETGYTVQCERPEQLEAIPETTRIVEVVPVDDGSDEPTGTDPEDDATRGDAEQTLARIRIEFAAGSSDADEQALLDGLESTCTVVSRKRSDDEATAIETVIATTDDVEAVVNSLEQLTYVQSAAKMHTIPGAHDETDDAVTEWLEAESELNGPEDELSFEETVTYGDDEMDQPTRTQSDDARGNVGATDGGAAVDSVEAEEPVEPDTSEAKDQAEYDMLERLLVELETGDVHDEQRERLRNALGVADSRSKAVRLTYLEGRVQEISAYADAMEAFIDDSGTAEELIAEAEAAQEALEALEERHEMLEARLEDWQDSLEERFDALESRIQERQTDLEQQQDTFDQRVTTLESRLDALEADHADVEASQRSIETQVDEHDEVIEKLTEVFRSAK